jgi:hypothetical protein
MSPTGELLTASPKVDTFASSLGDDFGLVALRIPVTKAESPSGMRMAPPKLKALWSYSAE